MINITCNGLPLEAEILLSLEKLSIQIYRQIAQATEWFEWQAISRDPDRDREKAIDCSIRDLRSLGLLDFYMGMKAHVATKATPSAPFVRKELIPPNRDQGFQINYDPKPHPAPTLGHPDALVHHREPQTQARKRTDPAPIARRLPMGGQRVRKGGIFDPAKFQTPLGSGMGAPMCPKEGITTPPPIDGPPVQGNYPSKKSRRNHAPAWGKTSAHSRATWSPKEQEVAHMPPMMSDPEWEVWLEYMG